MAQKLVESAPPGGAHVTDVVIIGAGPVGLFAIFELGLLGVKAHVIDILDKPGGQCAELYPEKPILDIPAIKSITGEELTARLVDQIEPFGAVFHVGEMAEAVEKTDDGKWRITTDLGTTITAPVIVIAAGGGSFTPKKPPIPGIDAYEGKSVFYAVRKCEMFRDQRLVIAGGGDSAIDWTLNLEPFAEKITLVHRRPDFRAAPDSVEKMRSLVDARRIDFRVAQITGLKGEDGVLSAVSIEGEAGAQDIPCDYLLPSASISRRTGSPSTPRNSKPPFPAYSASATWRVIPES
jgi:thioredoxin reductase (NADPH)